MLFWSLYQLFRFAPTNVLLRRLRSRQGLKWAIPAMLVLTPLYLWAAAALTVYIERGGPGWLHLVVLLLIWNAFKFLVVGPYSLIILPITWWRERPNRQPKATSAQDHHDRAREKRPPTVRVAHVTDFLPELRSSHRQDPNPHPPGTTPACHCGQCESCHYSARHGQQTPPS